MIAESICKSMLAWQNLETATRINRFKRINLSELLCRFDKVYKEEISTLMIAGKQKMKLKTSTNYSRSSEMLKMGSW
jgi:hypothetical protein